MGILESDCMSPCPLGKQDVQLDKTMVVDDLLSGKRRALGVSLVLGRDKVEAAAELEQLSRGLGLIGGVVAD